VFGITKVAVDLGPAGDSFQANLSTLPLELIAGAGADVALGGKQADVLDGGAQGDILIGGPGSDVLRGGDDDAGANSGDDYLDGGLGRDAFFPGDGIDTISFSSYVENVFVSLDGKANDGRVGGIDDDNNEHENVPDVEILEGGAGDDQLTAFTGSHELRGGPGDDAIYTGDGDDVINGGGGEEYIESGGGDDLILLRDGRGGDNVHCDAGTDTVVIDEVDEPEPDCERVVRPPSPAPARAGGPGPTMTLRARSARLTKNKELLVGIGCPAGLSAPCRGLVTAALRKRNGRVGERLSGYEFAVSPGATAEGRIPLNSSGRWITSANKPVRAFLITDARAGGSLERHTQVPIVLRRP
jgi:hypothetical protein